MHSHTHKESNLQITFLPYTIVSSSVAITESLIFYTPDTVSKRLQHHPIRVSVLSSRFSSELKQVIFPNAITARSSMSSLYSGWKTGIAYRVIQRNVMFVGQPNADKFLNQKVGPMMDETVGKSFRKPIIASLAGFATCVIEMPLLLLDTAKVRMQTQGLSFKEAITAGKLYNAAGITIVRNTIAATSLFGGAAFIRQCYGLNNTNEASLKQEWVASSFGATTSTVLNNWADMLKTRIQASNTPQSCKEIATTVWANEGVSGMFFRGLAPRLLTVAPRTAFAMTAVNQGMKKLGALSEMGLFSRKKNDPGVKSDALSEKNKLEQKICSNDLPNSSRLTKR